MSYLEQWLWLVLCHSTVLLGAAVVCCRWWVSHPVDKHSLCVVALGITLLMPGLTLILPPSVMRSLVTNTLSAAKESEPLGECIVDSGLEQVPAQPLPVNEVYASTSSHVATLSPSHMPAALPTIRSTRTAVSLASVAAYVWVLGIGVCVFRRIRSYVLILRVMRTARPAVVPVPLADHLRSVFGASSQISLMTCKAISSPFVFGWWRCRVVVPGELLADVAMLKQVVTHEYAHIHRRDPWVLMLQQVAAVVFWWQPMLKLVNREIAICREWIADKYVLQSCDALSYAETLVKLAARSTGTTPSCELALFSRPSALEWRVSEILGSRHSFDMRWRWTPVLSVCPALLVLFACGGTSTNSSRAQAQDRPIAGQTNAFASSSPISSPTSSTAVKTSAVAESISTPSPIGQSTTTTEESDSLRIVEGVVVDTAGQPIADCQVIEQLRTDSRQTQKISTTTDQTGKFRLSYALEDDKRDARHALRITWFYKQGHALKAVRFGNPFKDEYQLRDVKVVMPTADRIEARVVDADGRPVPKVDLYAASITSHVWLTTDAHQGFEVSPPSELMESIVAKTNAEGTAILTAYSASSLRSLTAISENFGNQSIDWKGANPVSIQMRPTAEVRGRIVSDSPSKYAGTSLLLISQTEESEAAGRVRYSSKRVVLDDRGEFFEPRIGVGELMIVLPEWSHSSEAIPVGPIHVKLVAGETAQVRIELIKPVEVVGKVLRADDRKPVAGVEVSTVPNYQRYHGRRVMFSHRSITDSDGSYRLYTTPGETQVRCHFPDLSLVTTYDQPKFDPKNILQDTDGPFFWPEIALPLLNPSIIYLKDTAGRAVPNMDVVVAAEFDGRIRYTSTVTTDVRGTATLQMNLRRLFGERKMTFYFFIKKDFDEGRPDASKALNAVPVDTNDYVLTVK